MNVLRGNNFQQKLGLGKNVAFPKACERRKKS